MSSIVIAGDTSGSVTLQAPAVSGSTTVNLPSTLGNTSTSAFATTDSSGNLGLGVTPSAWTTNFGIKAFDISNGCVYGANTDLSLLLNGYFNGTNFIYKTTNASGRYTQGSSGQHQWFTAPSGTAGNTISYTQTMTLDASGNLGVGTTTMTQKLNVEGNVGTKNGGHLLTTASNTNAGGLFLDSSGSKSISLRADPDNDASGTYIGFATDGTERARIDSSGRLLVGTTTSSDNTSKLQVNYGYMGNALCIGSKTNAGNTGNAAQVALEGWLLNNGSNSSGNLVSEVTGGDTSGSHSILVMNRTGSNGSVLNFRRSGTSVGNISIDGSSTTYSTSSDYRLKNTVAPMTGALAKVAQLKPVTYKWNSDGSDGQGFIAHEIAEVVPECVTGAKDAVDEEGNPQYQGIDTSFLVATLTAAIQEQQALITQLTERITALEAK